MPLKINYTNNVPGRGTSLATYQDQTIAGLVMQASRIFRWIVEGNGHGYVHELCE
ncbi:MAG TPA: hypothetical protein VGM53_32560 [Streptosporangiaceae bacterium]|jgi:hypothetical protein